MIFGVKMLPEEAIVAVLETAMETLSMETERLSFPALCFEEKLVPTEAFYRGLLEGFVVGAMRAKNLVNVTSGANVEFTPKNRRVFDDAMEKACTHGADVDTHATFFWITCYGVSGIEFSRELFYRRLQAAMFQDAAAYELGRQDALYQSSIAYTGMLEPTRKFECHLNDLNKEREDG